jgi:ABC-type protease/lipase transport system fused ATPase/permease subunit
VLSGGQRQRVGLARALFGSPRLVVLDEPNASLDRDGEQALLQALQHLKQSRATTVVITHKMSLLNTVDKLLIMQDGALAVFGPREAVFAHLRQQQGQQQQNQPQAVVPPPAAGGVTALPPKEAAHA